MFWNLLLFPSTPIKCWWAEFSSLCSQNWKMAKKKKVLCGCCSSNSAMRNKYGNTCDLRNYLPTSNILCHSKTKCHPNETINDVISPYPLQSDTPIRQVQICRNGVTFVGFLRQNHFCRAATHLGCILVVRTHPLRCTHEHLWFPLKTSMFCRLDLTTGKSSKPANGYR